MFSSAGFAKKGVEGIISTANSFIAGHLAVWLDTMLQAVKLPACITDLNASLACMDTDTLTLKKVKNWSINNLENQIWTSVQIFNLQMKSNKKALHHVFQLNILKKLTILRFFK